MKRIAMRPVIMAAAVAAVALFAAVLPLRAELPNQTIRIVFPFTAGASGDTLARLIAEKMHDSLDRTVIVENKLGADGRIGVNDVKMSTPDGTTLLLTPIAPISVYQHVYKKLTYDPINDFAPISQLATFDFAIAAGPQVPAKNLNDLIAWAKAHPTEANFAIPGAGTLPHFLGVLLGRAAKIDLRAVPYHGSAAGLADVIAGHIPIIITTTSDLVQMHKAGRIHILATSGHNRSTFLPDVPTFSEAGYKNLVASGWYGLFAPAKTPPDVVAAINKAVVAAVRMPDVRAKMQTFGLEPTGTSPQAFVKIVKDDSDFWAPAVEASGFSPNE
ncbi:MAG TPA: Bug family tripartite tricarboxylate transporter substrate binding protein [Xanthobacteraceae bacterium]|jgi:tripartite-type tricarboxylate transporter receptor subunit TctC|nr:Bug family tripartite tricarboxylate transporter substrate binding protein [Xanthobacteraceae bacterium]